MEFEWDDTKAEINYRKHRWIRIGLSRTARALVVVFVEKIEGEKIRIVSARKAERSEEKQYHLR